MLTVPAGIGGAIAALLVLVAAASTVHLVTGILTRRGSRDADILHILMAVAMAGMFAPALAFGPPVVWLAVFTTSAGWFTFRATRGKNTPAGPLAAQPVPLAIESAAMAYMLIPAITTPGGHGQMLMPSTAAGPNPALTLILALALLGYLLRTADNLATRTRTSPDSKLAAGCQISMSIAMGYMLITML